MSCWSDPPPSCQGPKHSGHIGWSPSEAGQCDAVESSSCQLNTVAPSQNKHAAQEFLQAYHLFIISFIYMNKLLEVKPILQCYKWKQYARVFPLRPRLASSLMLLISPGRCLYGSFGAASTTHQRTATKLSLLVKFPAWYYDVGPFCVLTKV